MNKEIEDGVYFLINYNINKIIIVGTHYSRISHASLRKFFCTQSHMWRVAVLEFLLSDFAYMEFSMELIMWSKLKLLTLLFAFRPLNNGIFHSEMWCWVKCWGYRSNNIFTECVSGSKSVEHRWQTINICLPADCSTHGSKTLLLRKPLLTSFFRFSSGLMMVLLAELLPQRCSLHAKPSALSGHSEMFLPDLFLIITGEKTVIFFYVLPLSGVSNKSINTCHSKISRFGVLEYAGFLDWSWSQSDDWGLCVDLRYHLGERIPALSSCCKNWMKYCWSVYQT